MPKPPKTHADCKWYAEGPCGGLCIAHPPLPPPAVNRPEAWADSSLCGYPHVDPVGVACGEYKKA